MCSITIFEKVYIFRYILLTVGIALQIHANAIYQIEDDHKHAHKDSVAHLWGISSKGFQYVYLIIMFAYSMVDRFPSISNKIACYTISGITMFFAIFAIVCNVHIRATYFPDLEKLSICAAVIFAAAAICAICEARLAPKTTKTSVSAGESEEFLEFPDIKKAIAF